MQSTKVISKATQEIKNSKKFIRFLEVVLKVGNVINTGSLKGGAYGFKLDTLTKVPFPSCRLLPFSLSLPLVQLGDTRTSNKDIPTLLHYIAAKGETDFPELNDLAKDFDALPHACRGLTCTHSPFLSYCLLILLVVQSH